MFILVAFLMGLVGSAHCAGMCGPLVMAYQHIIKSKSPASLTLYHLGRFFGYALIATVGYVFHWAFNMAGWQQYLSILCGFIILSFVFKPKWIEGLYAPMAQRFVQWTSTAIYAKAQHMPTMVLAIGGGAINGFLPCGLSYMAIAAAIALPYYHAALTFIGAFTMGTAPALLLAVFGQKWISKTRFYTKPVVRTTVLLLLSTLLILRGTNLNIPYLSPVVKANRVAPCCANKIKHHNSIH